MTRHTMTRRTRFIGSLVAVLVTAIGLSGCDFNVYKLPLPGGADAGKDPIHVTVMFTDVLDLVPKSTVKVNDVSVGEVTDVDLAGYTAKVTLKLRNDTDLPDNALATIRQTSLLGEKFVSLAAPPTGADTEQLGNGDVIPLARSGRNPEIEEVLGALSLVLNGGGVAQLQTITKELNLALGGREDSARSLLTQVDQLAGTLDDSKADIVAAIESLNQLSLSVQKQLPTIDAALEELPSALTSIDAQRQDLVTMLQALDQLSNVGVSVIQQSKASTINAVKQLQPVLTQLADSGDSFVKAFSTFYAYPFVDEVVGRDPQVARNLHMGDYTNLSVEFNVDLSQLPDLLTDLPTDLPKTILDAVQACVATSNPLSPECAKLLGNQVLVDYCNLEANRGGPFCTTVQLLLTGLPKLPLGGPAPALPLPSLPALPKLPLTPTGGASTNPLQGLPIIGQLFRPGTGDWSTPKTDGEGGPTMGQLMNTYDPALVSLLVPGMVGR
jgi:phospholipid/cholesterol/gamma-HCH transport system substrate-binding protein